MTQRRENRDTSLRYDSGSPSGRGSTCIKDIKLVDWLCLLWWLRTEMQQIIWGPLYPLNNHALPT